MSNTPSPQAEDTASPQLTDKKIIKVLVTAASGNAGKAIVEALLDKGFQVVAAVRDPTKIHFSRPVESRIYVAGSENDYEALLKGINALVLVAPPSDGGVDVKVAPLINAAKAHAIAHVVHLSGNYLSGMTGATLDALPIRKIELQVIGTGLKNTIVRAGFFMDNYLSGFYTPMVEKGQLILATGYGKSSLIAAADVGEFIAEALIQDLTGEYIVTGPAALDHFEVAELLSKKTGKKITFTPITEQQQQEGYISRGVPQESIDYGTTLYRAFRNHATAAITDGFRQATGREPVDFATFLNL